MYREPPLRNLGQCVIKDLRNTTIIGLTSDLTLDTCCQDVLLMNRISMSLLGTKDMQYPDFHIAGLRMGFTFTDRYLFPYGMGVNEKPKRYLSRRL